MGYSDQKYFSYDLDKVATAVAFGTATATSGTYAPPATTVMPKYLNQTMQITGIELIAASTPNSKMTAWFQILNGTNTIITALLGTGSAAGAAIYGSYTGTYTCTGTATADKLGATPANVFSGSGTGAQPVLQLVSTNTASADATGTWDVYLNGAQHV